MLVRIYGIKELSYENLQFYSVKLGNNSVSEYRDFIQRMSANRTDKADLLELDKFIQSIGESGDGADERFFRKEDFADRIRQPTPESYDKFKPDPKNYGLRLFALRLSQNVVILFNGDRKTYLHVQNCPNCGKYFEQANLIAQSINNAIYFDKKMWVDDTVIDHDDDFELAI